MCSFFLRGLRCRLDPNKVREGLSCIVVPSLFALKSTFFNSLSERITDFGSEKE